MVLILPLGDRIISFVSTVPLPTQNTLRAVWRVQAITVAWMVVETVVSLRAAWTARSPALTAFGGDSGIELLSALVVLWRFRGHASEDAERRAARVAGALLFALAGFVVLVSAMTLLGYGQPHPSYLGIAVLVAAALIMPLLAREKRRLSVETGSAALRADATESAVCAYLSVIALAGLAIHALWRIEWADPVAALVLTPLIVYEAREAIQGNACRCG